MRLYTSKIIENNTSTPIEIKQNLTPFNVQYLLMICKTMDEHKIWCGKLSSRIHNILINTVVFIKSIKDQDLVYKLDSTSSSYDKCFEHETWYAVSKETYEIIKKIKNVRDFDVIIDSIEVEEEISEEFKKHIK